MVLRIKTTDKPSSCTYKAEIDGLACHLQVPSPAHHLRRRALGREEEVFPQLPDHRVRWNCGNLHRIRHHCLWPLPPFFGKPKPSNPNAPDPTSPKPKPLVAVTVIALRFYPW